MLEGRGVAVGLGVGVGVGETPGLGFGVGDGRGRCASVGETVLMSNARPMVATRVAREIFIVKDSSYSLPIIPQGFFLAKRKDIFVALK